MREIKFRAWAGGVMVHFDLFNTHPMKGFDKAKHIQRNDPPYLCVSDDCQIMQYTGLKDKQGKEVYEGDIIIFDNTAVGGKKTMGEVVFNTDNTLGNLEWGLWCDGYHSTDFLGDIEIIGNIYEDPECMYV